MRGCFVQAISFRFLVAAKLPQLVAQVLIGSADDNNCGWMVVFSSSGPATHNPCWYRYSLQKRISV